MKKSLFLIAICLFSAEFARGQLLIGPKVGLQAAGLTYDPHKEYSDSVKSSFIPAFTVGSVLNIWITRQFSLQFEGNYSMRGRNVTGVFDRHLKHTQRDHYVEVPALLRYSKGKKTRAYFFNVGPNLSYWLGGSGRFTTASIKESDSDGVKYSVAFNGDSSDEGKLAVQDANRLQIGIDFGAGMQFPIQRGRKMMVELRYSVGHSYLGKANSVRNNVEDYSDNLQASNKVLSLSMAYVFDYQIHGWKKGKSTAK